MEESASTIDVTTLVFKVVLVVTIGLLPALVKYLKNKDKSNLIVVFFTAIGTILLLYLEVNQFYTSENQRIALTNNTTDTKYNVDTIKVDVKGVSTNLNSQIDNLVLLTDSIQKLNNKLTSVKGDVNAQLRVMEQMHQKNAEFERATKAQLALNEKEALKLVESKTLAIYFRMRDIIGPVKLMHDINIDNHNISINDLKKIVHYEPSKNKIYYKVENAVNSQKRIFQFYNDIRNDAKVIKTDIEGINQLPSTIFLPRRLQNLLSSILTSQLVVSNTANFNVKSIDDIAHSVIGFDKYMFDFIRFYNKLEANYIDKKYKSKFRKLTESEIANLKIEKRKVLKYMEEQGIQNKAYSFHLNGIEYRFDSNFLLLE